MLISYFLRYCTALCLKGSLCVGTAGEPAQSFERVQCAAGLVLTKFAKCG